MHSRFHQESFHKGSEDQIGPPDAAAAEDSHYLFRSEELHSRDSDQRFGPIEQLQHSIRLHYGFSLIAKHLDRLHRPLNHQWIAELRYSEQPSELVYTLADW